MKKLISVLLAILLLACALTGCGTPHDSDDSLSIVTTIFPIYDWVKQIMGNAAVEAQLTMLLDSGVDLHSYQPTAADMIRIAECDMFIYVGGPSDAWVEDMLANAGNPDMVVIDLLAVLGESAVKDEEFVEGMEHEHHHETEEEPEKDEHVWLSLKNAALICTHIADQLAALDPEHRGIYTANASAYTEELTTLDLAYQTAVDAAPVKTLVFADRFPFRYLVDDYGLAYYAAFSGCSAESEASFETVAFLAGKIDELGFSTVLTVDGMNQKLAETIIANTGAKNAAILSMHSMQSVSAADIAGGLTYLSAMEANLNVLKEALN